MFAAIKKPIRDIFMLMVWLEKGYIKWGKQLHFLPLLKLETIKNSLERCFICHHHDDDVDRPFRVASTAESFSISILIHFPHNNKSQ